MKLMISNYLCGHWQVARHSQLVYVVETLQPAYSEWTAKLVGMINSESGLFS